MGQSIATLFIVWTIITLLSLVMAQSHIRVRNENQLCPRPKSNLSFSISHNIKKCEGKLDNIENAKWRRLLYTARETINFMNCDKGSAERTQGIKSTLNNVVFLYSKEVAPITVGFEQSLACSDAKTKTTAVGLDMFSEKQEILKVLLMFLKMETDIRSVIIASSKENFIQLILNTAATSKEFKWRRFLHATEWFVLTNLTSVSQVSFKNTSLPDFVTRISIDRKAKQDVIEISQKSRTQPIKTTVRIPLHRIVPRLNNHTWPNTSILPYNGNKNSEHKLVLIFTVGHRYLRSVPFPKSSITHYLQLSKHFRKDAVTYLSSQKSLMAGMKIDTVIFITEQLRLTNLMRKRNYTMWTGGYIDILNMLSENLGFTPIPFAVADGGFYGVFQPNGDILGVVGYLARREAGLSTMAMVSSESRRNVIDFVYPHIMEKTFYIFYSAHFTKGRFNEFQSKLGRTSQNLVYLLIGPCVMLVVGSILYLITNAMLAKETVFTFVNVRRIYNFPLQWVFHTIEEYQLHSSRIMRASWGLFCVAMFASYGALITSVATAPKEYPQITSIDDLLAYPDYEIGVSPETSFFFSAMKRANTGTTLAVLWKVLCEQNSSDPRTFSTDTRYHIERVLNDRYVFLGHAPENLFEKFNILHLSSVKLVKVSIRYLHITVPKNAFYKYELERVVQAATDVGYFLPYIEHFIHHADNFEVVHGDKDEGVKLSSLRILAYISCAGVCLATMTFTAEKWLLSRRLVTL